MPIDFVATPNAPRAIGPYSQAIRTGSLLFCSGQVPLDPALVAAGDSGVPLVLSAPDSAAGKELRGIADKLSSRKRGLAGMSLGLDPARR